LPDTATIKQLLEAGAHFGHQTGRWHPRMKNYIFTKRNGIHIIDLEKTTVMLDKACIFVREVVAEGGTILFVGTKKQAQESVEEEALRCGMYYVNQRWLGGMLTNFTTIQARVDQLVRLEDQQARGEFGRLSKKEILKLGEKIERLNRQMGGFKEMTTLPSTMFIIDPTKERIALADAIRAVKLICSKIADAVIEGKIGITAVAAEAGEEEGVAEAEALEYTEPFIFTPDEE
jgi:small subunit ribosomal protein S2